MDQPIALPGDPIKIEVLLAQLRVHRYHVVQRTLLAPGVPLLVIERAPEAPSTPQSHTGETSHDTQSR